MHPESKLYPLASQPALDWPQQGQALLTSLHGALENLAGVPIVASKMNIVEFEGGPLKFSYMRFLFEGLPWNSHLAAIPQKDGSWLLAIEVTDPDSAAAEHDQWMGAISAAYSALGPPTDYEWSAVIAPTSDVGGVPIADIEASLDDLTFHPRDHYYVRYESRSRDMGGGSLEVLAPIVVSGLARAFMLARALHESGQRLLWACAILTLDTNATWVILRAPQPHLLDPASLPAAEFPDLEPAAKDTWLTSDVRVFGRAGDISDRRKSDKTFAERLIAFYHARTIERDSPSLACVMYVGLIESFGTEIQSLTTCDCCDACDVQLGYGRQFRAALKAVLPGKEARRLGKLYGLRSKTAHQGALHGEEFTVGFFRDLFEPMAASSYFLYQEVGSLREAARLLLLQALHAPTEPQP